MLIVSMLLKNSEHKWIEVDKNWINIKLMYKTELQKSSKNRIKLKIKEKS